MSMLPDGSLSFPSPQAVALPADFPPHPEITAFAATDDALNLAIRFPVRPHMLKVTPSDDLPEGHTLRTFISYPLYIPDPKEMRGSLGSVKSAVGGTSMGIRFSFLSSSSVKASVAAPEKYYEMVGNESTGYRLSSKSAPAPDYSSYASLLGYVAPFPRESLLALGDEVDADTDPMHWIADWVKTPIGDHYEGYLPAALPYCYRSAASGADASWPPGFDKDEIISIAETENLPYILLTRPMALTSDGRSRRNATPRAIRSLQVHGLPDKPAIAILCGSNDCIHWSPIRRSDPRIASLILSPPRFWWRLLLLASEPPVNLALSIQ